MHFIELNTNYSISKEYLKTFLFFAYINNTNIFYGITVHQAKTQVYSTRSNCSIKKDVKLTPNAVLREGSQLKGQLIIGDNFDDPLSDGLLKSFYEEKLLDKKITKSNV